MKSATSLLLVLKMNILLFNMWVSLRSPSYRRHQFIRKTCPLRESNPIPLAWCSSSTVEHADTGSSQSRLASHSRWSSILIAVGKNQPNTSNSLATLNTRICLVRTSGVCMSLIMSRKKLWVVFHSNPRVLAYPSFPEMLSTSRMFGSMCRSKSVLLEFHLRNMKPPRLINFSNWWCKARAPLMSCAPARKSSTYMFSSTTPDARGNSCSKSNAFCSMSSPWWDWTTGFLTWKYSERRIWFGGQINGWALYREMFYCWTITKKGKNYDK